jgi:hypothetical protein
MGVRIMELLQCGVFGRKTKINNQVFGHDPKCCSSFFKLSIKAKAN